MKENSLQFIFTKLTHSITPNALTSIRLLLAPIIMLLYLNNTPELDVLSAILCVIASITDFLDGYLARMHNKISKLGTILDPIADKVLVSVCLVLLLIRSIIHPMIVLILIARDMLISLLRFIALRQGSSIEVSSLGKWKTGFQMTAIPLLMSHLTLFGIPWMTLGYIGIYCATLLSIISALQYIYLFWKRKKTIKP